MEYFESQILIAGYYGHRNAGDESILQGMLASLREKCEGASFVVVSADPDQTRRFHNVRSIDWFDIEGLMDEVERSALVIVGGGGLFHDYWGFDETSFLSDRQGGISEFGSPLIWAHLRGIPCMLYGVGVGPLQENASRKAVRELFDMADDVVVRDTYSKRTLEKIGFDIARVQVAADPAFSAPRMSIDDIMPGILDVPRPLLGVSVRPWPFSGPQARWESEIARGLRKYLDSHAGTMLFVPMQDGEMEIENDVLICERIRDLIARPERVLPIDRSIEPFYRVSIFESCDLVLGMRLHALIGAIRGGVPCVGLSYDPKVEVLMGRVKLSDFVISLDGIKSAGINNALENAYEGSKKISRSQRRIAKEFFASAASISEVVQNLLDRTPAQRSRRSAIIPDLFSDRQTRLHRAVIELTDRQEQLQVAQSQIETLKKENDELNRHHQLQLEEAEKIQIQLREFLHQAESEIEKIKLERTELQSRLRNAESEFKELQHQKLEVENAWANAIASEQNFREQYGREKREWDQIKSSKGWKGLSILWRIVWYLRAWCMRFLHVPLKMFRKIKLLSISTSEHLRRILPIWIRGYFLSMQIHPFEFIDNSKVILFTDRDELFPGYHPRSPLIIGKSNPASFTLIATVLNEAENVETWLKAIEAQTRRPDEIIIVDEGSVDGTERMVEHFAKNSPLNIRLFVEEGINIARGRNFAIIRAQYDVIVVTDVSYGFSVNYLTYLLRPFEMQPETQVVAGWFEPVSKTRFGNWSEYELVPRLCNINPQKFIPASRSLAFRRSAWREVGGYPEWLTLTGEDTYFSLDLKRNCPHWAFVPEAVVFWHAPETLRSFWRKLISWSKGDGESGVYSNRYFRFALMTILGILFILLACGLLFIIFSYVTLPTAGFLTIFLLVGLCVISLVLLSRFGKKAGSLLAFLGQLARAIGFIQGVKRRPQVTLRRYADVEGVVFVLTGIPIDDTGGGSRGAQITRQFLSCNYLVVYLYKYPKVEHKDLKLSVWHPRLLHGAVSAMDWKALIWQYGDLLDQKQILALVEFPLKDFLPYIDSIKNIGGKVIYDLIDDWKSSLGGSWYVEDVEKRIYHQADILVATAQGLVDDLSVRSKRKVHLLPNAANLDLFDRQKKYERPYDFHQGDFQIVYIGALWGEWFDWQLLERIAERFPCAGITIIGDYDGKERIRSDNVHFLGLKKQDELPAYLAYSDVAIIPWKKIPLTQATSPLKVFEYLAMGLPVVAPDIEPLVGVPYVFRASTQDDFLDAVQQARDVEIDLNEIDEFVLKNSWATRVKRLLELIG
jgi:polysaccharide pyruvyl transferase CsaB